MLINPFVFAAAGPTDPFYANVECLINFEGPDGSSSFVDTKGHTVILTGSPIITTLGGVYPNGILDKSSAQFLVVGGLTPFGTGNFTIELVASETRSLLGDPGQFQVSTAGSGLQPDYGNAVTQFASGSSWYAQTNSGNVTSAFSSGIKHITAERKSGVFKIAIDGIFSGSSLSDTFNYTGGVAAIGGYYSTAFLGSGLYRAFRITVGVARYNHTNFTPPTTPFPAA